MKSNKREQVIHYLLEQLQAISPGEKLPSTLKIQKACGVSQAIVTRAIDELKVLDLIEIRPQSGFFKKRASPSNIHIVCPRKQYAKDDESIFKPNTFYNNHLSAITYSLTSNGYCVNFHHPDTLAELSIFHHTAATKSLTRDIIITFSLPGSQLDDVRKLEEQGFRFIHWLPNFIEPCNNTITIDEHALVEKQIHFLVSKGHRRIAYAHRCQKNSWSRPANARYDEFCRLNIAYQLQTLPEYLFYLDARDTTQEESDRIIAKAIGAQPPPTAIIVVDEDAKMIYNSLIHCGIEPGKEIAILGTNDHDWGSYMTPMLSSVGFNLEAGIAHLLEMIKDEAETWKFPPWTFPIRCTERESALMSVQ